MKNKDTNEETEKEEIPEEENDNKKEAEHEEKAAVKKKERDVEAVLNIYTSFNNTIAHVTDASGRTITKVSGGMVTKHSRLKANPTIAMFISKRISERKRDKITVCKNPSKDREHWSRTWSQCNNKKSVKGRI